LEEIEERMHHERNRVEVRFGTMIKFGRKSNPNGGKN